METMESRESHGWSLRSAKTNFSASMRNAQISAPVSRTPAGIKKGTSQNPRCSRAPKMMGDRDAAKLPAIFIPPQTVPLDSPPTTIGTAHAGLITSSRKNSDAVKHKIAVHAESAVACRNQTDPTHVIHVLPFRNKFFVCQTRA